MKTKRSFYIFCICAALNLSGCSRDGNRSVRNCNAGAEPYKSCFAQYCSGQSDYNWCVQENQHLCCGSRRASNHYHHGYRSFGSRSSRSYGGDEYDAQGRRTYGGGDMTTAAATGAVAGAAGAYAVSNNKGGFFSRIFGRRSGGRSSSFGRSSGGRSSAA